MKPKYSGILSFIFFFYTGLNCLHAQGYTITTTNITLNCGYTFPNLIGSEFTSQGTGSNGSGINPVYLELGYNYSSHGLVSFYFSDESTTTGNFYWLDTSNISHYYHYSVSIVTFGISSRYYVGNGENFRPYIGAMIGYDFINLSTDDELPASGSLPVAHSKASVIYRICGGATYYFNSWIGLDASLGYGNNYYVSVGLSFRFHLSQKTYKEPK